MIHRLLESHSERCRMLMLVMIRLCASDKVVPVTVVGRVWRVKICSDSRVGRVWRGAARCGMVRGVVVVCAVEDG